MRIFQIYGARHSLAGARISPLPVMTEITEVLRNATRQSTTTITACTDT